MDYARAIRLARAVKGITQIQLAEAAELDQSYISKLESGKRTPSQSVLTAVADGLELPRILLTLLASEAKDLRGVSNKAVAQELGQTLVRLLFEADNADG